jgi:LysM repeat protein
MIRFPKFITTLVFVAITSATVAQTEKSKATAYINQYKELAIAEMLRTGIPASIKLAQGILETGGGQSDLAFKANNHFGIKCKSEWTGETMLHDDDAKGECFRKYASIEASYQDHSDFLKNRPHYAFLFKLEPTDFEGWAKGLKKAGYATNPAYASKLMKIIVENNLQELTLLALQRRETSEADLFVSNTRHIQQQEASNAEKNDVFVASPLVSIAQQTVQKLSNDKEEHVSGKILEINETRVVFVQAGTSLFALANNYNISFKKLLDFNELNEVDILPNSQLIFLQKKPKKGNKDVHIVEAGENLYQICQKEGIQMLSILEYNRLQKDNELLQGQKLYLKYPAPLSNKLASLEKPYGVNSLR